MRTLATTALATAAVLSIAACADELPSEAEPTASELPATVSSSVAPMRSSVHWLSDLSTVDGATAQLTRTQSGVSFSFRTTGFEGHHVVTLWWVIFNNPEECENPIPAIGADCNLPDLFNPDVQASVMWAAGNIVGRSGRTTWGGHLSEGEVTTFHPVFVGSPGLLDAMGAEIHLVGRTHGPKIPGMVRQMMSTFEAGCTPGSSLGFGNGPNECADLQAAAFTAH